MLDARELFENNCARCHGKDGRARTFRGRILRARNLANEEWQAKATDEQIADAIKKGPRSMPSFENKLSQAEIDSLVKYVRDLKQDNKKKRDKPLGGFETERWRAIIYLSSPSEAVIISRE